MDNDSKPNGLLLPSYLRELVNHGLQLMNEFCPSLNDKLRLRTAAVDILTTDCVGLFNTWEHGPGNAFLECFRIEIRLLLHH